MGMRGPHATPFVSMWRARIPPKPPLKRHCRRCDKLFTPSVMTPFTVPENAASRFIGYAWPMMRRSMSGQFSLCISARNKGLTARARSNH
jgi:hypothetical protein